MSRTTLLTCLAICSSLNAAEPPAIERLFPPGGQRGSTFEVKLIGKAGDGDMKVLSEADSITFALGEKRDTATVTIAPAARAGVHWLRFYNMHGATELKPFAVGLIPEISEAEPNAKIAEAQAVTLPSVTINGVLDQSRDVDTFAVELTQGQTLVAAMQAHQLLGSPMDAVLQITNEKGTVLAQDDDDTGFDPRLAFTAPADGKWFVRTFAFPAAPNSTIAFASGKDYVYRLTLGTDPFVEHTSPVIKFVGDAETKFTLHGWNLSETTASLPGNSTTLDTGVALPFPVEVSDIPVVEESQLDAERLLALPVAVSGHITTEDADSFILNAVKSQKISLAARAQAYGSMLDPVLAIYDKDGKQLKESDDVSRENPDADMQLTIPADGQYRITVRDRFQSSSDRHFYVLSCEETRPSFHVSVKSTAFTVPADKPLEIPVTIERLNGFSEAVEFHIEGLPDGITAECPRSEKDGDSSKAITLKLTGSVKESFQGAVKITAESVDSKEQSAVVFTTSDRKLISELWMTAVAPEPPATEPAAAEESPSAP